MILPAQILPGRRFFFGIAAVLVLISGLVFAASPQVPSEASPNPAIVPTDRLGEPWWAARHRAVLDSVKSHPDTQLLLIGDSITNNYDKAKPPDEDFQPTWQQFYAPRKALNLGFSGDTTANLLWRLDHGEVAGLRPKVAILLIGTNNTGHAHQTAEETEGGIDAVIAELERLLPETRILLLPILPSGLSAEKSESDRLVNAHLALCYGDNPRVAYLDISSIFFEDGKLNTGIYYDPRLPQPGGALHPDTTGQRRMAEAIEPTLASLMQDAPRVPLDQMTDINTALIPVPRLEFDSYDWYARHNEELALNKTLKPQLVMIGDSITHFWGGLPRGNIARGNDSWRQLSGAAPAMNLGFGWDRTQNVLWRLQQGEFDGLAPKWVVLLIGTNNLTGTESARANTPAEIVEGVAAICREIHLRSPYTRIALMAILPRGATPSSPLRAPIQETNLLLATRFANQPGVTYLDIGAKFLAPDGSLPAALMPDGTHPSEAGYRIWADALVRAGVTP